MSDPLYIIGIDLGTTNSVVAYTDAHVEKGKKNDIHVLNVPQLVGAGVDHRVGGKFLQASHFSSWGEVEDMMQLWAAHGSYNLCELQKRTDCVKPTS